MGDLKSEVKMKSSICNHYEKKLVIGDGVVYERDKKEDGTDKDFIICNACSNKLMDGNLKWADVAWVS